MDLFVDVLRVIQDQLVKKRKIMTCVIYNIKKILVYPLQEENARFLTIKAQELGRLFVNVIRGGLVRNVIQELIRVIMN